MEAMINIMSIFSGMSDEVKFRLSILVNVAILISILSGGALAIITGVQWKDAVDNKLDRLNECLRMIQEKQAYMESIEKRVDAEGQRLTLTEQHQMNTESKVDALTSLLNEFMGSIRAGINAYRPNGTPVPTPVPTPSP